ncbi:MAG: hypothetical protein WBC06_15370 [Chitinophagaceae bacterium]
MKFRSIRAICVLVFDIYMRLPWDFPTHSSKTLTNQYLRSSHYDAKNRQQRSINYS